MSSFKPSGSPKLHTLAVLVPVKRLDNAKSRLAGLLSPQEREHLAAHMLGSVLEALAVPEAIPAAVRRVLVTNHAPAAERARALGFEVLHETQQVSESASVDAASAALEANGITGVLRVPLDLPLLTPRAVADLWAEVRALPPGLGALLAPSREGTGTNALYRSPPTLFASRFGPGSLALHQDGARRAGVEARICVHPAFALDIDDPADIAALLAENAPSPALAYLRELGALERLRKLAV